MITPQAAKALGIVTDNPTLISQELFSRTRITSYLPGYETQFQDHPEEERRFIAYPDLKTAILDIDGVPFTGFVAVGKPIGHYRTGFILPGFSNQYASLEKMQVLGIKAFIKDSEVKNGYVEGRDFLKIVTSETESIGRNRFSFRIIRKGEVKFKRLSKQVTEGGDKYG